MANTYTLISSNVLTSSAASVTFSSIPATYTDLVLRCSVRNDETGATFDDFQIKINGSTSTLYSYTYLQGSGSGGASSGRDSSTAFLMVKEAVNASGASGTINTFSSIEVYFPNYAGSENKVSSAFAVSERNNTFAYIMANANLFRSTSAITSIELPALATRNFVSGSSFYLYGIKNS